MQPPHPHPIPLPPPFPPARLRNMHCLDLPRIPHSQWVHGFECHTPIGPSTRPPTKTHKPKPSLLLLLHQRLVIIRGALFLLCLYCTRTHTVSERYIKRQGQDTQGRVGNEKKKSEGETGEGRNGSRARACTFFFGGARGASSSLESLLLSSSDDESSVLLFFFAGAFFLGIFFRFFLACFFFFLFVAPTHPNLFFHLHGHVGHAHGPGQGPQCSSWL